MGQRLDLHAILQTLGAAKVYFQEPEAHLMEYPCIIYHLDTYVTAFADDVPFRVDKRYMVTVIDENPDSEIPDRVAALPRCRHERLYVADHLYHNVFQLFF